MFLTVVDEHTQLFRPDLVGTVTKHKQHRVNDIRLATTIWTNDGSEVLKGRKANSMVQVGHSKKYDQRLKRKKVLTKKQLKYPS